jgi:CRISPR-associated protein Cas1
MTDRILYFGSPVHLSTSQEQLVVCVKETGEERRFPLEDLGLIELDGPQQTLTTALLQKLMAHNVAVLVCDAQHLPAGLLLPTIGHTLQQKHQQAQMSASKPLQKQLWQQTVTAKIRHQALALELLGREAATLHRLAKAVKSGDAENAEGLAAQYYWKEVFADRHFRREPTGDYPNSLLNYGYAVLRAITARAIVGAGLLPALGIFHRNQYNPYPLADDLMEPFRPVVDLLVAKWLLEHPGPYELNRDLKAYILQLPTITLKGPKDRPSLQTSVQRAATQLARCYLGTHKSLQFAAPCPSTLTK